jgi:hypothetical protein
MVAAFFYGNAFVSAFNKEIDFNSDDIRVAILDNTHVPSQDSHNYFDDVVADEVVGTGYTAGGVVLGTPTISYDGGTNTFKLDGDNISIPDSVITGRFAVVYSRTPATDATRPLIACVDFEADISSSGPGVFSITWDAAGIATITVN